VTPALRTLLVAGAVGVALLGCQREQRRFGEVAPASGPPGGVVTTELRPGGGSPPAMPDNPYERNAWAVAEGKQLYERYNCVGCHAHGGGGMGPALMDKTWIYGSRPDQVFSTIIEGRPNGMPAFRGKVPNNQAWQLAAFVRSMAGLIGLDVAASRDDDMSVKKPENRQEPQAPPKGSGLPAGAVR
jgi:cytochrome c oxidase cbb3-type subunit III